MECIIISDNKWNDYLLINGLFIQFHPSFMIHWIYENKWNVSLYNYNKWKPSDSFPWSLIHKAESFRNPDWDSQNSCIG